MQTLGDLFTIWEKKKKIEGLKVAYVGDGNNVCNSLLVGSTKLGMSISVACPENYEPDPRFLQWAHQNSERTGSVVEILREPEAAVVGADVIYTDVFTSMGQEHERDDRLKVFLPTYQVNEDLLAKAREDAIFMHNLPCHRGEEVTGEVVDGPRSAVWDQAENRLHTTKALLSLLL